MPVYIDETTAEEIRKAHAEGKTYPELAKKYKMQIGDLSKIIKGGEIPSSSGAGADILMTPEGSFIKVTMWVPVLMFNLFDYAVAVGLSKHKDVGAFMFHYAQVGFKKEHGLQLSLARVFQEGDGDRRYEDLLGKYNALIGDLEALKQQQKVVAAPAGTQEAESKIEESVAQDDKATPKSKKKREKTIQGAG